MNETFAAATVAELASRDPRLREVFDAFGIHHCCAGHVGVAEAAAAAGVPLDTLLAALSRAQAPDAADAALDVRGLEPPHPMLRVLERVESLRPDETLTVLLDRRPLLLYPQLERRGLVHETDELEPTVVRVRIRRPV